MRNIPFTALTKIQQRIGTEPLIIIGVKWTSTGHETLYADKYIGSFGNFVVGGVGIGGTPGKILDISGIDDVTTVSGTGSNGNITIKLDDTDGSIKKIIDINDVHKQPVTVYQGFSGFAFDETPKFPIYEGEINTPLIWSEADRTFTFDVVTKIEDREVGFAAEEGQFSNLPPQFVGKVWPLAFGQVRKYPAMTFQVVPIGITVENLEIIDRVTQQISDTLTAGALKGLNDLLEFTFVLQAQADGEGNFDEEDILRQQTIDIQEQMNQIRANIKEATDKLVAQKKQLDVDIINATAQLTGKILKVKEITNTGHVTLLNKGKYFPIGMQLYYRIGEYVALGQMNELGIINFQLKRPPPPKLFAYFDADGTVKSEFLVPQYTSSDMYVNSKNKLVPIFDGAPTIGSHGEQIPAGFGLEQTVKPNQVKIIPAGTNVTIISDIDIEYVVNIIPTNVLRVWAYKSVSNVRLLMPVPTEYWRQSTKAYGDMVVPTVVLKRPLSGYAFENWEDQIYVDQDSSVGPNIIAIFAWIIGQYTTHKIDETSFNEAARLCGAYPCNFVLEKRGNVLAVLAEMAYQARCAIWLKNGVFFVRYLPQERDADDTITEDDVEVGTMSVSCTTTEDIVTKIRASYKIDYSRDDTDLIIVRNFIEKYGLIVEEDDFYIYTDAGLVRKSATFWIIRKSNTWKKISFKTMAHKLRLETFDTVLLNFHEKYVSAAPVKALVESANYDSADNTINFTCWVPIRLGTMSKYGLAWPATASETDFFPEVLQQFDAPQKPAFFDRQIAGAFPLIVGGGTTYKVVNPDGTIWDTLNPPSNPNGPLDTIPEWMRASGDPSPSDIGDSTPGIFDPNPENINPSDSPNGDSPIDAISTTNKSVTKPPDPLGASYPAKVIAKEEKGTYHMLVYKKGLGGKASETKGVVQLEIAVDGEIPKDTWAIVSKVGAVYYMQCAVWLP